jgi:hypothetical protein
LTSQFANFDISKTFLLNLLNFENSDRPLFLQSFLSLALWSEVSNTPWMLVGDFNIHLHTTAETSHSAVLPWYEWLCTHFDNCFPDGAATFPQAGTTIDYIFGHRSLATRLVNALVQYVPPKWTDHCLLTVDLLPARASIGPGCWRFNPTLLDDTEFLALLDKTVALFFDGGDGDSDNSSHALWRKYCVLPIILCGKATILLSFTY